MKNGIMGKKFLLIGLLVFLHINVFAQQGIGILSSDENGVTLQYSPTVEQIDTIRLNNEIYFKIHIQSKSKDQNFYIFNSDMRN